MKRGQMQAKLDGKRIVEQDWTYVRPKPGRGQRKNRRKRALRKQ